MINLQELAPGDQFTRTFSALHRAPAPTTRRMTLEIEVPASWTDDQLRATVNQQADIRVVEES